MPIPTPSRPSMSRLSTSSPVPPSPRRSNIPRPSSAASVASHTRMMSGPASAPLEKEGEGKGDAEIRNVRVVLRVRPAGSTDSSPPRQRNILVHPTSSTEVRIDVDPAALMGQSAPSNAAKRHPSFTFDQVLDQGASQADLYDATARDVVDEYLKGHNITFLAYGQTSSGKSYSMGTTGEDVDYSGTDFTARTGLIPRTVKAIFDQAEAKRAASGLGASWECRLSFLELYNEEIIDLLSGSGVQITIREERDGRIIWSGVKEVPVRSLAEVMFYLQDGSTKRKTGETGMNATSSRSHAIFSLTMTQKRRSSVSTSPTTPTMKRPVSYAPPRSGTPTKGVAPPVSLSTRNSGIPAGIASAIPRSSSVMSLRDDEMVIMTSKFNMVDLAGSERLKRTAAQGERMREGISINSGLSALGNVISALSDPIKAKGHIPYRDSKLTRMLQDSIGGNALTTMIACVSPVEYNIAETLNTIKYASRARNIKNAAKVNAVEAGWDDVEHLQNTVLKLRKQLAQIEVDGGSLVRSDQPAGASGVISQDAHRQSEKLIQRLAELQKEHTDLYDRYLAKCNDNMRLTSELRASVPGDADALAKFNETVEPVILEYEKVVNALNVQLEDLRAQLSLMDTLYEEQGSVLGEAQQAQTQAETYVEELRARLEKLGARNTSSEAYIADLETRLKGYSETEQNASDSTIDLRNQLAKLRESNKSLSQHATEIEARLAQSEGKSTKLAQQVDELEKDLQRRDASYKELEERIVLLDTSSDNKALLAELEVKNAAIAELERKVDESSRDKEEKEQLENELKSERTLLADLQGQLADIGKRTPSSKGSLSAGDSFLEASAERTSLVTPGSKFTDDNGAALQAALDDMQARVEAAEVRYIKAEEHVAELKAQLREAQDEMSDALAVSPSASADDSLEEGDNLSVKNSTPTPSPARRSSVPILSTIGFGSRSGANGSGFRRGRGGYGETKMLHQAHTQISSSASMGHLGQRPLSLAALAAQNKSAVLQLGNKQRTRPQSLSQELSSAQRSLTSRSSWSGTNSLLLGQAPHTAPTPGGKTSPSALRTQQSIEAELKFVHRVIEERDTELRHKDKYIRKLENALSLFTPNMGANSLGDSQPSHNLLSLSNSANNPHLRTKASYPPIPIPSYIPLPDSPALSPANPDISLPSSESVDSLSGLDTPATPASTVLPIVAVITPSNERMDPMSGDAPMQQLIHDARDKESSHRHIIEQQFVQIAELQKTNHVLRGQLAGGYPEVYRTLLKVQAERDALVDGSRTPTKPAPSSPPPSAQSLNAVREEHAAEIQALITGHVQAMQELEAEHAVAIRSARSAVTQTSKQASEEQKAILDRIAEEHAALVTQLKVTHAKALSDLQQEAEAVQSEINAALLDSEEHRRQLKLKVDQAVFELSRVKDEHVLARQASQQQIADLQRIKGDLETANSSLQDAKADVDAKVGELQKDKDEWLHHLAELQNTISDLNRRNAELENTKANSRKTTPLPPQGPPPNMPLPPTPQGVPGTPLSPTFRTSTPLTLNRSGSAGSHASLRGLGIMPQGDANITISDADIDAAANLLPPHLAQIVKSLQKQRENAVFEGERMRRVSESGRLSVIEAETNLADHVDRATALARELADARKTNSKLRAHLEDARQDNRRISDENRDFLSELTERRSQLNKIDEVKRAERESLLAANQQVAKLKAQLQQASDGKVSKKTGGLRCF